MLIWGGCIWKRFFKGAIRSALHCSLDEVNISSQLGPSDTSDARGHAKRMQVQRWKCLERLPNAFSTNTGRSFSFKKSLFPLSSIFWSTVLMRYNKYISFFFFTWNGTQFWRTWTFPYKNRPVNILYTSIFSADLLSLYSPVLRFCLSAPWEGCLRV